MTEQDFIAELSSGLRMGPLTKRRILREVSQHLEERARERSGVGGGASRGDGLAEPRVLAAEFTATYATHRLHRMERAAAAIGFGVVSTVLGCAAILGVDADGDRLAVELPFAVAVAAALSLAVLSRSVRLLAISLFAGAAAWLGWSAHLVTLQVGLPCVVLLVIGVTSAAAGPGLLRSLREYV